MDYTGHTIVDGVLKYASVSAVKMFDRRTKGGCPRRWAYRYVFGKKEAENDKSRAAKDKGIELDGKLKNYLRTGDKALSALALKGLHILETPGDDLWIDLKLHTVSYLVDGKPFEIPAHDYWYDGVGFVQAGRMPPGRDQEVIINSGLTAAGVPFIGEIDYAHARGHFRNDDGEFEDEPADTVEICDLKFKTSATDRDGNSTFMHETDLIRDIQMAGYGEWFRRVRPQTKNARLSLLYYPENKGLPTKVTRLHVVNDCAQTWQYVDGVVGNMKEVAREKNIENVPYEAAACHAWGKSEKSRCPHAEYCTAYERTAMDSLYSKVATDFAKEPDVGLLASNPQMMQNAPVAQAPTQQPDMRAQLAAEEQTMRQQVAQQQRPSLTEAWDLIVKLLPATGRTGFPALGGRAAYEMGTARGYQMSPNQGFAGAGSMSAVQLMEAEHVYQLLSELQGAAPQPAPIQYAPPVAAPPPVAVPQTFTQQVAQAYQQQMPAAANPNPGAAPISFLPPDAPPSMPQLAADSAAPTPPPATAGDAPKGPGRPRKKKESQDAAPGPVAAAAVPPSSVAAPQAAPAQLSSSLLDSGAAATSAQTIVLVNARLVGRKSKSLADYVDFINAELSARYSVNSDGSPGVQDVRCAPKDSILAFGGWKGAVREVVKSGVGLDGLEGAVLHLDTFMDELNEAVADALRVIADKRGWLYIRAVRA